MYNLRGSIEPADYKRYVLPIIFLRFLSLRYERRRAELEAAIADPKSDYHTTEPKAAESTLEDLDEYLTPAPSTRRPCSGRQRADQGLSPASVISHLSRLIGDARRSRILMVKRIGGCLHIRYSVLEPQDSFASCVARFGRLALDSAPESFDFAWQRWFLPNNN